jgi:hypothetical protein
MGLKTTNYIVKDLGITLPTAYAKITEISLSPSDWVNATFIIQSDRENTSKLKPIEVIKISFKWDRKTNIVETAYNLAKSKIKDYEYNEEKGVHEPYEKEMPLYGWQDDKV